ncbi:MAG: hypothetical protein FWD64_05980 [Acidobacteriaceae bacterium]|nr:hypothetical protein [Acidobacteriaceae bacterium]
MSLFDKSSGGGWEGRLKGLLPVLGHRNWIVVTDAAYPAQSNPGIETLYTGEDHVEVLGKVAAAIAAARHIRANIYLDAELNDVPEADAPGVNRLREQIGKALNGQSIHTLEHEQIIARLDQSARLFNVVILKSTLTIPYTSVFFELDCGYWNAEAEKRLRESLREEPVAARG